MDEPKPIELVGPSGKPIVRCIGYRRKDSRPYLVFQIEVGGRNLSWYMKDGDAHRLERWVKDCRKKRK